MGKLKQFWQKYHHYLKIDAVITAITISVIFLILYLFF